MNIAYLFSCLEQDEEHYQIMFKKYELAFSVTDTSPYLTQQEYYIRYALSFVPSEGNLVVNKLDDIFLSLEFFVEILQELERNKSGLICNEDNLEFKAPLNNLTQTVLQQLPLSKLYKTNYTTIIH